MSKHTPGPYRWRSGRILSQETSGEIILEAKVSVGILTDETAALIAAAPKLLIELKKLTEAVAKLPPDQKPMSLAIQANEAFAAIAEAEGKP